jgi:hypothetical protein
MIQATDTLEVMVCSGMESYPSVLQRVKRLHDAGLPIYKLFTSKPIAEIADGHRMNVPVDPAKASPEQRAVLDEIAFHRRNNAPLEAEAQDDLRLLVAVAMRRDLSHLLRAMEQRVQIGSVKEAEVMERLRELFKRSGAIRKVMSDGNGEEQPRRAQPSRA